VNPRAQQATTIAVAPTETVLGTFDTDGTDLLTAHVYNADATQTLEVVVRFQARSEARESVLPFADGLSQPLGGIAPLTSRVVDIAVGGSKAVRLVATMSGAGGNCVLAVVNTDGK